MASTTDTPSSLDHVSYLKQALDLACKSPPKPTNFRVGALIVSPTPQPYIVSWGYTLELPGNTHAEQCCLAKLASHQGISEADVGAAIPAGSIIYSTMEPCGKRLSGASPCVQRIIDTRKNNPEAGIRKVYFGVREPGTFVGESQGCKMLTEAGIEWEHVPGLEEEILAVATTGHGQNEGEEIAEQSQTTGKNGIDDITEEDRQRQAALPRNPKKRMMEAVPPPPP